MTAHTHSVHLAKPMLMDRLVTGRLLAQLPHALSRDGASFVLPLIAGATKGPDERAVRAFAVGI